jgi:hypothetical protein
VYDVLVHERDSAVTIDQHYRLRNAFECGEHRVPLGGAGGRQ